MSYSIALIGGDKRLAYAARRFREHKISTAYVGDYSDAVPNIRDVFDFDALVLPITGVNGGVLKINGINIDVYEILDEMGNRPVFMGRANTLNNPGANVHDLLKLESFAVKNAQPTAESALQLAMESFDGTILGSKCLVIGYGRIGKLLSRILKLLGAKVKVSTTSSVNRAYIACDGNVPVNTRDINCLDDYDIVFNTADALIIDKTVLSDTKTKPLIIDLASVPGGVDYDTAAKMGFKVIQALGLPGKYSPKTAGNIIADTVVSILKEEYGWQI